MEEQTQAPSSDAKTSGYGKKPMWQWVVLYLVVGGVVYAAVYYLWLMPQGGYDSSGQGQQQQQDSPY
jgi:hypothetical protein